MRDRSAFLAELIAAGLFVPSGVDGVYGRGGRFEEIRTAVEALITRRSINVDPERMAFPPLLPKEQLERIGYLSSFPHLAGTIFSFDGDESEALELERRVGEGEDWSSLQSQTALALIPAACYPVYPAVAARGPLPADGVTVDLGGSYVFRNEPSQDPARLQMFHQREMVRLGEPDQVLEWRDAWSQQAVEILGGARPRRQGGSRVGPVLRPQRQDARAKPAVPGAEARGARLDHCGRADRRRVVQLPTASTSRRCSISGSRTGSRHTRRASASASSASRWRCSAGTASTRRRGPAT